MMKLQLIDHDGKTVVSEYDLGSGDGQWNVWNEDEGSMLLNEIQQAADCDDEDDGTNCTVCKGPYTQADMDGGRCLVCGTMIVSS